MVFSRQPRGAVVAVVYSLILSLVFYKSIKVSELPKLLMDSAEMTGIIIFLIGVSSIMSWVMVHLQAYRQRYRE